MTGDRLKAKRSLGQNFLVCSAAVGRIVGHCAGLAGAARGILEIGPGRGALTGGLMELGLPYFAIEKDFGLCGELSERYPGARIALGDALDLDLPHVAAETGIPRWLLVGNLPYNAGTKIVLRLMRWPENCAAILVMLQREVAEKFSAGPGEPGYCAISAWRGAWWDATRLFDVPPGSFSPAPKVTSTFCEFSPKAEPLLPVEEQEGFWDFTGAAFAHPRKMLAKNLPPPGEGSWAPEFESSGIRTDARPADVPPGAYAGLYRAAGK